MYLIGSRLIAYDTGERVETPAALVDAIEDMSPRSLFFHVHDARRRTAGQSDDFSLWLEQCGAEASLIAPLDYTGMIWAILFGFWIWGDVPTWVVLAGAAVVICSSLYIVRREAMLRRRGESKSAGPPA